MSLFDKFKKGVTEAGAKAINTVEANRLKGLIVKNNEQIESLYTEIGKKIFSEYHSQPFPFGEAIEYEINQIQTLISEIKQLEKDIKTIWNKKDCQCGKSVPLDSKFCSACGYRFNVIALPEGGTKAEILEIEHTSNPSTKENKLTKEKNDFIDSLIICPHCDTEIESDAKFCGDCGQML